VLCYATAKLLRDEAESKVPNIDPEQVRKLAGWGLTQNDRASFVGWSPQPSAVGPVRHQPGFLITWSGFAAGWGERSGAVLRTGRNRPPENSGLIPLSFRPVWPGFFGPIHERISR